MVNLAHGASQSLDAPSAAQQPSAPRSRFSRRKPYDAPIVSRRRLTGERSSKEVWHVRLAVPPSVLGVAPGDVVAVLPTAPQDLVAALLRELGMDGSEPHSKAADLRSALTYQLEVSVPSPRLLRLRDEAIEGGLVLAPRDALDTPASGQLPLPDVLDLVADLRGHVPPTTLVGALRPVSPRAFSVASSAADDPTGIDLTVARLRESHRGRSRYGMASQFLIGTPLEDSPTVRVFSIAHPEFRLVDDDRPVIMIAAGTGVAPFRGFIQQLGTRTETRSWLFFGDRQRATDYLYEDEFTAALDTGALTRISLAFSRDGAEPRYVQHAMEAEADDLIEWLKAGARVYVCGHGPMASAVEQTLTRILDRDRGAAVGQMTFPQLLDEGRYLTDVYDTIVI